MQHHPRSLFTARSLGWAFVALAAYLALWAYTGDSFLGVAAVVGVPVTIGCWLIATLTATLLRRILLLPMAAVLPLGVLVGTVPLATAACVVAFPGEWTSNYAGSLAFTVWFPGALGAVAAAFAGRGIDKRDRQRTPEHVAG